MNRHERRALKRRRDVQPPASSEIHDLMTAALRHHQTGQLTGAERIYRQILAIDPDNADCFHLLGLIAHQAGDHATAIDLIRKAIGLKRSSPAYFYNLGLILKLTGNSDEAKAAFEEALAIKPDYADVILNIGNILLDEKRLDEAKARYQQVIAVDPNHAQGHNNLGNVLYRENRFGDALAHYERACALKPDFAEACNNFGNLLRETGDMEKARRFIERACALNPDYAEAYANLGLTLAHEGSLHEAFSCFRKAARLQPSNGFFWKYMGSTIKKLSFTSIDDTLFDDLEQMLAHPSVGPETTGTAVLSALRCHPDFDHCLNDLNGNCAERAEKLSAFPLFLRLLRLYHVVDSGVERKLATLRRDLVTAIGDDRTPERGLSFFAVLAIQCFVNEYVFSESDDESHKVERLEAEIAARLGGGGDIPAVWIAALVTYRPLHKLPWAARLRQRAWPEALAPLLAQQVDEPFEEAAIRTTLPCLTPSRDSVSLAVRDQYEQNPYPRWVKMGLYPKAETFKEIFQAHFTSHDFAEYPFPDSPDILIAGCGTGKQALSVASKYANARFLAVDLSLSSLAYAVRKTREYGFTNIDYAQADILELGSLGRRFDIVECGGVLHHLGDPMAGWRVLTSLLKPNGFMKIGLYSDIARRPIVKARAMIAEKGFDFSPKGIRRCRDEIVNNTDDPAMAQIATFSDFFTLSNCRDLLFHVQEHRFTVPQIEEALNALGLKFMGFELKDMEVEGKFKKLYSGPDDLLKLPLWHAYEQENPNTFASMYNFWCQKI
jgi:tetratricopeptide (TPR) repeat protein/2-polyprenyl-3-methyl-5-hydroxy-6-metoxy-1,4-benzoquinol methylase